MGNVNERQPDSSFEQVDSLPGTLDTTCSDSHEMQSSPVSDQEKPTTKSYFKPNKSEPLEDSTLHLDAPEGGATSQPIPDEEFGKSAETAGPECLKDDSFPFDCAIPCSFDLLLELNASEGAEPESFIDHSIPLSDCRIPGSFDILLERTASDFSYNSDVFRSPDISELDIEKGDSSIFVNASFLPLMGAHPENKVLESIPEVVPTSTGLDTPVEHANTALESDRINGIVNDLLPSSHKTQDGVALENPASFSIEIHDLLDTAVDSPLGKEEEPKFAPNRSIEKLYIQPLSPLALLDTSNELEGRSSPQRIPISERKSGVGGLRKGPHKIYIPYRGDNPEVGRKTGLTVERVERESDGFEPFERILEQADRRITPRPKGRKKIYDDYDYEDGRLSMHKSHRVPELLPSEDEEQVIAITREPPGTAPPEPLMVLIPVIKASSPPRHTPDRPNWALASDDPPKPRRGGGRRGKHSRGDSTTETFLSEASRASAFNRSPLSVKVQLSDSSLAADLADVQNHSPIKPHDSSSSFSLNNRDKRSSHPSASWRSTPVLSRIMESIPNFAAKGFGKDIPVISSYQSSPNTVQDIEEEFVGGPARFNVEIPLKRREDKIEPPRQKMIQNLHSSHPFAPSTSPKIFDRISWPSLEEETRFHAIERPLLLARKEVISNTTFPPFLSVPSEGLHDYNESGGLVSVSKIGHTTFDDPVENKQETIPARVNLPTRVSETETSSRTARDPAPSIAFQSGIPIPARSHANPIYLAHLSGQENFDQLEVGGNVSFGWPVLQTPPPPKPSGTGGHDYPTTSQPFSLQRQEIGVPLYGSGRNPYPRIRKVLTSSEIRPVMSHSLPAPSHILDLPNPNIHFTPLIPVSSHGHFSSLDMNRVNTRQMSSAHRHDRDRFPSGLDPILLVGHENNLLTDMNDVGGWNIKYGLGFNPESSSSHGYGPRPQRDAAYQDRDG